MNKKHWWKLFKTFSKIYTIILENQITKAQAKIGKISKNICMWEGDNISLQNAGD